MKFYFNKTKQVLLIVLWVVKLGETIVENDSEISSIIFDSENLPGRKSVQLLSRSKRQATTDDNCQFDVANDVVSKCALIVNADKLKLNPWRLGVGTGSYWIGGPSTDASDSVNGGYSFACMSDLLQSKNNLTAWMLTTPRPATDEEGRCLKFKYSLEGLSSKSLDIYLINYKANNISASEIDSTARIEEDEETSNVTLPSRVIEYDYVRLLEIRDTTGGKWMEGKASFSSLSQYSIAFVASADARYELHRGFAAVDNIEFTSGPCDNDCLFDKDLCSWSNTDLEDNFDWLQGRSTTKRGTGPVRDQQSSLIPSLKIGGYVYIDSDYPRQAGDRARLVSPELIAGEEPQCLTFWANMFGEGIGTLEVLRQIADDAPTTLWKKSGTTGVQKWNPSQLTVTAPFGSTYKVIFQAEVGEPGFGDIGLDSIIFREGACPQLPELAADPEFGPSIGDCTFLIGTCRWKSRQPPKLTPTQTPMLEQVIGAYSRPDGRTMVPYSGRDKYMSFEMGIYKHRVRDSAYLESPTIQNTGEGMCLSFWFFMYTSVPTEIRLGALTVIVVTSEGNSTVWRLQNKQNSKWEYAQVSIEETSPFKVYIMGTKGTKKSGTIAVDDVTFFPSNCSLQPSEAIVSPYDCTFDKDQCNWNTESASDLSPKPGSKLHWRYASFEYPLSILTDHTYGAEKSGFMFIEALNSDISSRMVSATIDGEGDFCLKFYFASYYSDQNAKLSVSSRDGDGEITKLWSVTQANLPPRPDAVKEVEWNIGQVSIAGQTQAVIEGEVRNGGWAIDDIRITNGTCLARPLEAEIISTKIDSSVNNDVANV